MYELKRGDQPVPINHVDIAPTSLGLCGIEAPEWMCGTDYSGYRLRGKQVKSEPDSAYLQICTPTGHHDSVDRPWRGVVTKDGWKYAILEGQPWLLFNLNEDPFEQVNLAHNTKVKVIRKRLQSMLRDWMHNTGDEFLLPDI